MSDLIRQMRFGNANNWMPAQQPYKTPPGFEQQPAVTSSEPVVEGVPPLPRSNTPKQKSDIRGRSLFDSPPTPIQEIQPGERRFNVRPPKDAPFDYRKQTT